MNEYTAILCDLLMASAVLFSQLAWTQSLNHQVKVIELEKAASGLKTRLKTA